MQKFGEGFLMVCACVAGFFTSVVWSALCIKAFIRLVSGT